MGVRDPASCRAGPGPPLRRRPRAALAGPVHRAVDVPPALGPGRAGPLRLRVQRRRHHRGVRLGPGHRPAPQGHRPAQRHPPGRAAPGRRDDLLVRRHRRRRVRALGRRAVRRPAGRRRAGPGAPRRAGRLPGRSGDRPDHVGRRHLDRRGQHHLAAERRGPRVGRLHPPRGRQRRGAVRGRDPARDQPLRARRLPAPGGAGGPDGRFAGRREVRRPRPRVDAAGLRAPGRGLPAVAAARAARPRGAAALGSADRRRAGAGRRPARRGGRRLLPGRRGAAGRAHPRGPHPALPVRAGHRAAAGAADRPRVRRLGGRPAGRHGRVHLLVGGPAGRRAGPAPGRHGPAAGRPAGRAGARLRARDRPMGGRPGRPGARARRPATRPRPPTRGVQPARRPARGRRGPVQRHAGGLGRRRVRGRGGRTTGAPPATGRPGGTPSRAGRG